MARAFFVAAWALGLAAVAGWWGQVGAAAAGGRALVLGLLLVAGLAAWRGARDGGACELAWDGQGWIVTDPGGRVQRWSRAVVALDLQALMLVRLAAPGQPGRWLWLARRAMPVRWLALRRALHAQASRTAAQRPGADTAALS